MSKQRKFSLGVMVLIVIGTIAMFTFSTGAKYWGVTGEYDIHVDTLTVSAAAERDSTSVWKGVTGLTISVLPGLTSTDPDSFSQSRDSTDVDIYVRGWTDGNRGLCMGQIQLWDPFDLQILATPAKADSATKSVSFTSNLYTLAAGTGSWDSSRVELTVLENQGQVPETWPFYDILIVGDTNVGNNSAYKIQATGVR